MSAPALRVSIGNLMPLPTWTTQDEIAFLRRLADKKDAKAIRRWLNLALIRRWHGEGMHVEVGRCILAAKDMLEELEGSSSSSTQAAGDS